MSAPIRPAHGLVVGKFYPPHQGHVHLVRSALDGADLVTVEVLHSSVESIPGLRRAAWLRDCFPQEDRLRILEGCDDLPIDYQSPSVWDGHIAIMKALVHQADSLRPWPRIDAIFTSETYGREMARRFEAREFLVDLDRSAVPISGTMVRRDPPGHWHLLPPPVQAGLARRVVVVGAESTGTTTLSVDLHLALVARSGVWAHTEWVAEYGREYSENIQLRQRELSLSGLPSEFPWSEADFIAIAQEQNRRENHAASRGSPVLVCDTDSLATRLWHERYRGSESETVATIAAELAPRSLYLLTSHLGVEFEEDGLRDQPQLRPAMTQRFREMLGQGTTPWFELVGSRQQRLDRALELIEADLTAAYRFTDPLG